MDGQRFAPTQGFALDSTLPSYRQAVSSAPSGIHAPEEDLINLDGDPQPQQVTTVDIQSQRTFNSTASSQTVQRMPPPLPPKPEDRSLQLEQSGESQNVQRLDGSSVTASRESERSRPKYAMLLMGATGAGKSSFVAAATGKSVQIGHTLDPCTTSPEGFDMVCRDGTAVSLIDTPGFNDLRRSDMDVLTAIINYVRERKQKIIAVIYLHRISEKKITGSTRINLRMLRAICGEHFFQNVALVTSMWGTIPPASWEATLFRELEFNSAPEFWIDMIDKGAKYDRWDEQMADHGATAKEIVENSRSKKDAPLLNIFLEMEKGATIEDTSAGQILTEELRKRQEKERKALQEEEEEMMALEHERQELQGRLQHAQEGVMREAELAARRAHERRERRPDSTYGLPPPGPRETERRYSDGFVDRDRHYNERRPNERWPSQIPRDERYNDKYDNRYDNRYDEEEYERTSRGRSGRRWEQRSGQWVLIRPQSRGWLWDTLDARFRQRYKYVRN